VRYNSLELCAGGGLPVDSMAASDRSASLRKSCTAFAEAAKSGEVSPLLRADPMGEPHTERPVIARFIYSLVVSRPFCRQTRRASYQMSGQSSGHFPLERFRLFWVVPGRCEKGVVHDLSDSGQVIALIAMACAVRGWQTKVCMAIVRVHVAQIG
jgi:hypothetical protein